MDGLWLEFRASGLNLVIAAIVYLNSTYLADAVDHLRNWGPAIPAELLAHTSPLTSLAVAGETGSVQIGVERFTAIAGAPGWVVGNVGAEALNLRDFEMSKLDNW